MGSDTSPPRGLRATACSESDDVSVGGRSGQQGCNLVGESPIVELLVFSYVAIPHSKEVTNWSMRGYKA